MGSFIGGLITKKKRKKLTKAIQNESQYQLDQSINIAQMQEQANDVNQLQANFAMRQERIQAIREARIRRAEVVQAAANAGAQKSTTAQTAYDTIYTNIVAGVGRQNVLAGWSEHMSGINSIIGDLNTNIIESQGRQNVFQARLGAQAEKANLIGGALDMGMAVAGAAFGAVGVGAMAGAAGGAAMSTGSRIASGFQSAARFAGNAITNFGNFQAGNYSNVNIFGNGRN